MAVLDQSYVGLTLIVTIALQLFFFAIAFTFRFDKVTDLAGSLNFVLLALLVFLAQKTYYVRQIVNTVLVLVWGCRLGIYLFLRVLRRGKDDRFDEIRDHFSKFLGFFIFQMMWAWLVSLPVTFVNAAVVDVPLGPLDYVGWSLWLIGFVYEVLADTSKQAFVDEFKSARDKILESGVWYNSRHPNYFGEILLWLGLFLSSCSVYDANSNWGYFSIASPLFTFVILTFGSGLPPAEERADKRYGNLPAYVEYKLSVSPLWPCPRFIYRRLPRFIQRVIFLDLDRFSRHFAGRSSGGSTSALDTRSHTS